MRDLPTRRWARLHALPDGRRAPSGPARKEHPAEQLRYRCVTCGTEGTYRRMARHANESGHPRLEAVLG